MVRPVAPASMDRPARPGQVTLPHLHVHHKDVEEDLMSRRGGKTMMKKLIWSKINRITIQGENCSVIIRPADDTLCLA